MPYEDQAVASPEEIRRQRRKCWSPQCRRRAWLEDWCGWKWCFHHFYRNTRWGGGNMWFDIKNVKIF